jgi:hypothetical protein
MHKHRDTLNKESIKKIKLTAENRQPCAENTTRFGRNRSVPKTNREFGFPLTLALGTLLLPDPHHQVPRTVTKRHHQRIFPPASPQNLSCSTADSGTVIEHGRGNEDLIVPASMLAISLVASNTSDSPTV